jgi:hypothetical protein
MSRDLDADIAWRVFNVEVQPSMLDDEFRETLSGAFVPHYSSDMNLALRVIEVLRTKGITLNLSHCYHTHDRRWDYVVKAEFFGDSNFEFELGINPPELICLVALMALDWAKENKWSYPPQNA